MNRRGFALLTALWLTTALSVFAGAALSVARLGTLTTRNRIVLARAGWAREACVEILLARYTRDPTVRGVDTVDLGRETWCRAEVEDPGARLNVNTVGRAALVRILTSRRTEDALALVEGIRVIQRSGELVHLREVPRLEAFADHLTTRGTGAVNVNAAPEPVLRAVPGLGEEAVRVIRGRRASRRPIASVDELAALLSGSAKATLLADYHAFLGVASFAPTRLVARVEGGVRGTALLARATLTLVPLPDRLAVIGRETE